MSKKKPVTTKPTRRATVDPRESRSRGYEAGYDGKSIDSGDGSDAWRDGWNAAVKATGWKLPAAGLFDGVEEVEIQFPVFG